MLEINCRGRDELHTIGILDAELRYERINDVSHFHHPLETATVADQMSNKYVFHFEDLSASNKKSLSSQLGSLSFPISPDGLSPVVGMPGGHNSFDVDLRQQLQQTLVFRNPA